MSDIKGMISLARKAGYVVIGLENLKAYDKKLYLLLCDKTAGKSLVREMNFIAEKRNAPLVSVDKLENLVAIRNCKVIGIRNKNFSEMILQNLNPQGQQIFAE